MIDSHAHLWMLGRHGCIWPPADLHPIHRDFTIPDLRAASAAAGTDRFLLVQSQEDERDTGWLLSLADNPAVAGVVGWCDFESPDSTKLIKRLAANPALRGLRPMVQERGSDWYDSPALVPAFEAMAEHGLVLDALIRPRHLRSLERLAGRHPDLQIVIDHGAKPDFSDLSGWEQAMTSIAHRPNVTCKLSGLLTELPPGAGDDALEPAFDILWKRFGRERLIWGSDWPVLTLRGTYDGWANQARRLVPAADRELLFDSNARRVYGIGS